MAPVLKSTATEMATKEGAAFKLRISACGASRALRHKAPDQQPDFLFGAPIGLSVAKLGRFIKVETATRAELGVIKSGW
jgi:hypothetical protein